VFAILFFRVVPLHSNYMLAGLGALGIFGVAALAMDPERGMAVTVPVLLLQMFAVSSGFAVPARRGHFDLLLTGGVTRLAVAIVHWAMSVAPGVAAWLVLGCVEWALTGHPSAALSNGSIAAAIMISTLGWAVTVPLPRLTGGVMWLVAFFLVIAASQNWREMLLRAVDGGARNLDVGAAFVLCPLLLVGTELDHAHVLALLPGIGVAVIAMAAAIAWIVRADISLEAAQ
jgi:hypothetical protein